MCCLFGFVDHAGSLSVKQKCRLIREFSIAAEVRGTDATGIAYNTSRGLQIYKRPLAAHRLHLRIPAEAHVVLGHTRLTTQGSAKKNYNNHPFFGHVKGESFALAHNGVLWNDLINDIIEILICIICRYILTYQHARTANCITKLC